MLHAALLDDGARVAAFLPDHLKQILGDFSRYGASADQITSKEQVFKFIEDHDLKQVTDLGVIEKVVDEIMSKNPDKVADARSNPKAIGWFVGQVMKSSGGKASPRAVNDLLKKKLGL